MKASYLIRFDDLCPTMNWTVWGEVERLLAELGVRPMLAVIPENRDERLNVEPARDQFWDHVRAWQDRGWTIGVHGYQHVYVTSERGLFGWNDRSEFAGLPVEEQESRVEHALDVFRRESVRPEVWMAPNHSFDMTTVALLYRSGIRVISDGLSLFPYRDRNGMTWVPQQLWRFRSRPLGVWTVCNHHNGWTDRVVAAFSRDLSRYRDQVTDLPTILLRYGARRQSALDRLFFAERRVRKWWGGRTRRS